MRHKRLLAAGLGLCGLATFGLLHAAPKLTVPPTSIHAPHTVGGGAVLQAAQAFLATLSAEQRQAVIVGFNATNAAKWSNFPCGIGCRAGLLLKSLTPAQQAAALAVVQAATGTVANDGFDEIQQIRAVDDNLAAVPAGPGRGPGGGPPPGMRPRGAGGPPGGGPPGGGRPPFGGGPPPGGMGAATAPISTPSPS